MSADNGVTIGIVVGVLAVLVVWRWILWWVGWRKVETPLSEAWRASHDYSKDGDDRQWK